MFYDDDDDEDNDTQHEHNREAGDYNLGDKDDDFGTRIGKNDEADDEAL